MVKVGVVGGTGYTGVELLRLLCGHCEAQLVEITSRGDAGTPVADMFPSLRGRVDTPNGIAMEQAARLLDAGVRVIDLAADFRIRDVDLWEQWYGMRHASPELVAEAVYGLPEINRDRIRNARLVANPGCYPTAVQLGFLPLIEADVIDLDFLIADAKSGASGAGRKAEVRTLLAEAADNFQAYGASGHRHLPEIRQGLAGVAGVPVGLTFVPHLLPMVRGIHATLYGRIKREVDFQALFENRFAGERFVDVMPPGRHPETRSVRASNLCRIAVHRQPESDMVIVLSVIDNLVKGAAGQAVQNMNIMFGLDESLGLDIVPVSP